MTTREQLTHERVVALARLLSDDGVSAPGEIPTDHVRAVCEAREIGDAPEVARRHKEGRGPPESAGPPNDRGGGPPNTGGGQS